jgi:YesN/AraC family two-component response regulator
MAAHLCEKLSLEKIASDLNYSVSHMTKLYHRQTGESIICSFTKMKMAEALRRIQEGNKSITQIATDLGYDNIAYFSRVFMKHHGITATEAAHSYKLAAEDAVVTEDENERIS